MQQTKREQKLYSAVLFTVLALGATGMFFLAEPDMRTNQGKLFVQYIANPMAVIFVGIMGVTIITALVRHFFRTLEILMYRTQSSLCKMVLVLVLFVLILNRLII